MPYATREVTHEAVLLAMKPGALYLVHSIARKFGASSAHAKEVLLEMVEAGKLSRIKARKPAKNQCFMLAGTEHMRKELVPKPQIDRALIALPRTHVVLTGEIRGYDAEIARRQQLCMMVRRVG